MSVLVSKYFGQMMYWRSNAGIVTTFPWTMKWELVQNQSCLMWTSWKQKSKLTFCGVSLEVEVKQIRVLRETKSSSTYIWVSLGNLSLKQTKMFLLLYLRDMGGKRPFVSRHSIHTSLKWVRVKPINTCHFHCALTYVAFRQVQPQSNSWPENMWH